MATRTHLQWTEDEWMAVIGQTLPLLDSGYRKPADALEKAQRKVLPRSRQRDRLALGKLCTPSNGGYDRALAQFKALPKAERAAMSPAPPAPAPASAKADAEGPVRWTTRERAMVTSASAVEVAAVAPEPAPAGIDAAVALFGQSMMAALGQLLQARDALMVGQVVHQVVQSVAERTEALPERIGPLVQELLQAQIGQVAEEVTRRVRAMLVEELGGPSSSSPPPAPSQAPGEASAPLRAPVLRIDVLGTIAADWMQRIREAMGEGDELRFVDFASARDFSPHRGRHLILMQQGKIPRVLQQKLEATGVKPMVVRDAGGHVLRAVQDLKGGAAATLQ
jgi:hypothetical protein